MSARRLVEQARQELAGDFADLGRSVKDLSRSIGRRLSAEALLYHRRNTAWLYLTKRRISRSLDEDSPWLAEALGLAKRDPKRALGIASWWIGSITLWAALVIVAFNVRPVSLLVTAFGLAAGVAILLYLAVKYGPRLRDPALHEAVKRTATITMWRARAAMHDARRALSHWRDGVLETFRRPHARV